MIEVKNVSKSFSDLDAVKDISFQIQKGTVFGLVGINGAGKSTLLRMLGGIYQPDEGEILVDGTPLWHNVEAKKKIFYISDEQYFFQNADLTDLGNYYSVVYPDFDLRKYRRIAEYLELNPKKKINTYSKGMKKQLSMICGICSGAEYLICDETFDGLDPVIRQVMMQMLRREMAQRGLTLIAASHSMRELEDICNHIGLLYKGGLVLSRDVDDLKLHIHKVQCVFPDKAAAEEALRNLKLVSTESRGSLYTVTVRGDRDEIMQKITAQNPVFYESLPLSLEEIFISETEGAGYDYRKIIGW